MPDQAHAPRLLPISLRPGRAHAAERTARAEERLSMRRSCWRACCTTSPASGFIRGGSRVLVSPARRAVRRRGSGRSRSAITRCCASIPDESVGYRYPDLVRAAVRGLTSGPSRQSFDTCPRARAGAQVVHVGAPGHRQRPVLVRPDRAGRARGVHGRWGPPFSPAGGGPRARQGCPAHMWRTIMWPTRYL